MRDRRNSVSIWIVTPFNYYHQLKFKQLNQPRSLKLQHLASKAKVQNHCSFYNLETAVPHFSQVDELLEWRRGNHLFLRKPTLPYTLTRICQCHMEAAHFSKLVERKFIIALPTEVVTLSVWRELCSFSFMHRICRESGKGSTVLLLKLFFLLLLPFSSKIL